MVLEATEWTDVECDCTELSEEQDAVVNRALRGGPADQVLVEGFRLQICRRDIATLSGLNWLNDEVSDLCLWSLMCFGGCIYLHCVA